MVNVLIAASNLEHKSEFTQILNVSFDDLLHVHVSVLARWATSTIKTITYYRKRKKKTFKKIVKTHHTN